jgi:hypothetical protein
MPDGTFIAVSPGGDVTVEYAGNQATPTLTLTLSFYFKRALTDPVTSLFQMWDPTSHASNPSPKTRALTKSSTGVWTVTPNLTDTGLWRWAVSASFGQGSWGAPVITASGRITVLYAVGAFGG